MKPFIAHLTDSQRVLHAFILTLVPNLSDADDILQETNLVLWDKRDEFTPGTNFQAWAFRIARYQVMAQRKRQSRFTPLLSEALLERLAETAAARSEQLDERREALLECLGKLKQREREIVLGRYRDSLSGSEIAETSGLSVDAVYQLLHRTRESLLRCVQQALETEQEQ